MEEERVVLAPDLARQLHLRLGRDTTPKDRVLLIEAPVIHPANVVNTVIGWVLLEDKHLHVDVRVGFDFFAVKVEHLPGRGAVHHKLSL